MKSANACWLTAYLIGVPLLSSQIGGRAIDYLCEGPTASPNS